MDGYAVRAADTAGASDAAPVRLHVVGDLPAGHAPTVPVGPGQAIRIMTGAPIPDGADAIVMVERTERDGTDGVRITAEAARGDHVRAAGGDLETGDAVFDAGTVLGPAHLGVLCSLGLTEIPAYPRVRVGVISTGDELQEGPVELAPGQIRDSNRPMLLALVAEAGAEPVDLGIGRDDEAAVTALFRDAAASCDAIITTGGVSVGDYDVVKAVLEQLGTLEWWQVAIKPAKPFAFGTVDGTPIFGLPGNPVSSHVSFELFARPALRRMMGHAVLTRPVVRAVAGAPFGRRTDGRLHLDRVRVTYDDGRYVAVRSGAQASNALSGMAAANGLALLPDGDGLADGDDLDVMLLI
jgi:molybdenum cofactor synthesis domain-containing protein